MSRRRSEFATFTPRDRVLNDRICYEVTVALEENGVVVGTFAQEVEGWLATVTPDQLNVDVHSIKLPHGAVVSRIKYTDTDAVFVPRRYTVNWAVIGQRVLLVCVVGMVATLVGIALRLSENGRLF